jgi:flagellar biosynthesis protein FliP
VLAGLALFLTLFVMAPDYQINTDAAQPYMEGTIESTWR